MILSPAVLSFIANHVPEGREEPLTQAEQALVGEALEEFLLIEQWQRPASGDQAFARLSELRLARGSQIDQSTALAGIEAAIAELTAQLARREDANHVMREHLTLMSHELSQHRTCRHRGDKTTEAETAPD